MVGAVPACAAGHRGELRDALGRALEETRARTLELVQGLAEDLLARTIDPLQSPVLWDLGHIANFEELWLVQRAGGRPAPKDPLGRVYDAFEHPRAERSSLAFLRLDKCLEYMAQVRRRALEVLEAADLLGEDPLLRDGFVHELVIQHERQHQETILQTLQLLEDGSYSPPGRRVPPPVDPTAEVVGMAAVPAGPFLIGDAGEGFAYDNERPQHEVELRAFFIDRAPVTNSRYLAFVEDGGYVRRELWDADGWSWRRQEQVEAPRLWRRAGGEGWSERSYDREEPLDPRRPVVHISWYEADAYARWAGLRLPTEAEWERAAVWDEASGRPRRWPWGDDWRPDAANLDGALYAPAPVGSFPSGASPVGCHAMAGDVWEWTASPFQGYPGFTAFPYREYSEVFFGTDYRVLRGGSWATSRRVARPTFRNWDLPQRRQIFAGFRCARDA